jgi:uncharacterized protein YecE (DUF72 family)
MPETGTFRLLRDYNVAYTIIDEPLLPPEVHLTADFAYFRWHGHGREIWFDYRYSKDELEPWVPKIQESAGSVKKVYGTLITTITGMLQRTAFNYWRGWACYQKCKGMLKQRAVLNKLI